MIIMMSKMKTLVMKSKLLVLCLLAVVMVGNAPMVAYASGANETTEGSDITDLEWIKTSDNGAFDEVTETVKATGGSAYKLLVAVGSIGFVLCLMATALLFGFSRDGRARIDNFKQILIIIVAVAVFFGVFAIIGLGQQIGASL